MNELWLLYEDGDYAVNRDYAQMMQEKGQAYGLSIRPVLLSEIALHTSAQGEPFCLYHGRMARPRAVLSRQRDALISEHFERMGVPVFNNARVCALCNDKRRTHQFLQGLPMMDTLFLTAHTPPPEAYPVIVKPACSHGGDRVLLARSEAEWRDAVGQILPEPALQQRVATEAGRDLRVYVLHGRILAGVMRTARSGVVSNFKRGGHAELHELTQAERELAEAVIRHFEAAGAPLHMAGVDLLYDHDRPVVGEVEDVVGSRMLYRSSTLDIADLYLRGIRALVANEP